MAKLAAIAMPLLAAGDVNVTAGRRQSYYVSVGGVQREYQYKVPTACARKACPLLMSYHGQYGSIPNPGYDNTANTEGWITVYLQGMGDGNCGTGWNTVAKGQDISNTCTNPKTMSGSCCYTSCKQAGCCTNQNIGCRWATCADDVAFTEEVIAAMGKVVQYTDLYATGESNGGMFMHNLMTSLPTTFKAIVPVYGLPLTGQWEVGSSTGIPTSLKGTSVFYMHGRSDTVIPVNGGLAGGWTYVSEAKAMEGLASVNGCSSKSTTFTTPYDGLKSNTQCVQMEDCNGVTISECLYNGAHGAWPTSGNELLFWWLNNYGAKSTKDKSVVV